MQHTHIHQLTLMQSDGFHTVTIQTTNGTSITLDILENSKELMVLSNSKILMDLSQLIICITSLQKHIISGLVMINGTEVSVVIFHTLDLTSVLDHIKKEITQHQMIDLHFQLLLRNIFHQIEMIYNQENNYLILLNQTKNPC